MLNLIILFVRHLINLKTLLINLNMNIRKLKENISLSAWKIYNRGSFIQFWCNSAYFVLLLEQNNILIFLW